MDQFMLNIEVNKPEHEPTSALTMTILMEWRRRNGVPDI